MLTTTRNVAAVELCFRVIDVGGAASETRRRGDLGGPLPEIVRAGARAERRDNQGIQKLKNANGAATSGKRQDGALAAKAVDF